MLINTSSNSDPFTGGNSFTVKNKNGEKGCETSTTTNISTSRYVLAKDGVEKDSDGNDSWGYAVYYKEYDWTGNWQEVYDYVEDKNGDLIKTGSGPEDYAKDTTQKYRKVNGKCEKSDGGALI